MRIGVDASRATAQQRTGTEKYSLHLIRELLSLGTHHQIRLYFSEAPSSGLLGSGAEVRTMPFPRLWTHVRLSWEMLLRTPDVLFVPSHVLPIVHPRRSVVTVHDLGFLYHPEAHTAFQNAYLRWSTRYNGRSAARVVADSHATRLDLVRHYRIEPGKIRVIYPGRDESLTRIEDPAILAGLRARLGLPDHYLLYVGTLHPRKNLVRLVEAFGAALPALPPGTGLVLAGKVGWLHDALLVRLRQLGLQERVLLPGYVADADLPALLSGASAFLFPSLYEGFGLPVIEAMTCGVPVVCSNVSSLPEVAGDAALLVDPLDTGAWAQAIDRVSNDEPLRRDLEERGRRQVARFSWGRCAAQVLDLLEEVGHGAA